MPKKQSHKSDIKKARDELFKKARDYFTGVASDFLEPEEFLRLAHRADLRVPRRDIREVSPLHFIKDPLLGLKFKVKFKKKDEKRFERFCSECGEKFYFMVSGHRRQCSDNCFKKHKARDQKERRSVSRQKGYEDKPPDERPDGFCKICHKDISYRRAGALVCENPAHRKKWNRMKKRENP